VEKRENKITDILNYSAIFFHSHMLVTGNGDTG